MGRHRKARAGVKGVRDMNPFDLPRRSHLIDQEPFTVPMIVPSEDVSLDPYEPTGAPSDTGGLTAFLFRQMHIDDLTRSLDFTARCIAHMDARADPVWLPKPHNVLAFGHRATSSADAELLRLISEVARQLDRGRALLDRTWSTLPRAERAELTVHLHCLDGIEADLVTALVRDAAHRDLTACQAIARVRADLADLTPSMGTVLAVALEDDGCPYDDLFLEAGHLAANPPEGGLMWTLIDRHGHGIRQARAYASEAHDALSPVELTTLQVLLCEGMDPASARVTAPRL